MTCNTREIPLADALSHIAAHNRELADALSAAALGAAPNAMAFLLSYSYGQEIVRDGTFRTPCVARCATCERVASVTGSRDRVTFDWIPFAIVTAGACEVYERVGSESPITPFDDALPLAVIETGQSFGVFETADRVLGTGEPAPWSVSAGLVSAYVVSRRRSLSDRLADSLMNKWAAAQHKWRADILLLPDSVFANIDRARLHLLETAWRQSAGVRRQFSMAPIPHLRSDGGRDLTNKKANEILRHLVHVIAGERPAFGPVSDNSLGPFAWKQEEILERTREESYFPQIIAPRMLRTSGQAGIVPLSESVIAVPGQSRRGGIKSYVQGVPHLRQSVPDAITRLQLSRTAEIDFLCKEARKNTARDGRVGKRKMRPREKEIWSDQYLRMLNEFFTLPNWADSHLSGFDADAKILSGLVHIRLD